MKQTVSILIIRNNHYLLQHRDNKPEIANPGSFGVWGGSVEPTDTSPIEAAIRELAEETGLNVHAKELIPIGSVTMPAQAIVNAGQMIEFLFYSLELTADIEFIALEGQGVIELVRPYKGNPHVNIIAREAIERYEAIVANDK